MVRNRTGASIRTGSRSLAPWSQKRRLKLYFGVPEGSRDNHPDGRAVLTKVSSRGVGDYKLFAEDAIDIDALMSLVRQVLEVAKALAGIPRAWHGVRAR